MYWPLTGAFMNVSAVTLRLLLIITAYMDDLLHEDTNIFSVNNKDCLLHTDSHGFSFHTEYHGQSRVSSSHGISRTVTDFSFLSRIRELSNFVFTRNITDSHGFSFLFFLSRIIEFSNFNHTEYHGRPRIFFFPRIIETCPWTH